MSKNMNRKPDFLLFHINLFLGEKEFTLRFPVPEGWTSDEEAREEKQLGALLTPAGLNFTNTNVFISVAMMFNPFNMDSSEEIILQELENNFVEDGCVKDTHLSSLRTYDNRMISVLTDENRELEYIRKNLLLPLKEDLTTIVLFGFQINNLDKQQADALFPVLEALIRGCKLTETAQDFKENEQYARDLAEKGLAEYFSKL